jgi:hypothetical protein
MFLLDDLTPENVGLALLAIALMILIVSPRKRHAIGDDLCQVSRKSSKPRVFAA